MAQNDNMIQNCKECGHPILMGSGDLCQHCRNKKTKKEYSQLIKAEKHISKDSNWIKGYSAWTAIMTIPVIILLLVAFFYILSLISK